MPPICLRRRARFSAGDVTRRHAARRNGSLRTCCLRHEAKARRGASLLRLSRRLILYAIITPRRFRAAAYHTLDMEARQRYAYGAARQSCYAMARRAARCVCQAAAQRGAAVPLALLL